MNLSRKQTKFAQPNGKSRTVLANEWDHVCDCWAEGISSGKEIREQEFYYETIALLILVGKRLGESPSRKYRNSTKFKALLVSTEYFSLCFYFDRRRKGAHFYQRRTILWGYRHRLGESCPKLLPPGSATVFDYMETLGYKAKKKCLAACLN